MVTKIFYISGEEELKHMLLLLISHFWLRKINLSLRMF